MSFLRPGPVLDRINQYNTSVPAEKQIVISGQQAAPVGKYAYYHREGTKIAFQDLDHEIKIK